MSLDSKEKRVAVLGVARPWMRDVFPVTGKDREWRSAVGLSYPVANFQSPSGVTITLGQLMLTGVGI